MRVVRKPWNYLFDVVLPLFLISLYSLSSLACARDDLPDRLTITLTMILTSITFKSIANSSLPTLSYQVLLARRPNRRLAGSPLGCPPS